MNNKILNIRNIAKKTSHKAGFTLIELMVALSIFTIIILIGMGSVLVVTDISNKVQGLRTSMDNVNFAMESMTRSIRMGTNYTCGNSVVVSDEDLPGSDCSDGGKILGFTSSIDGKNVFYHLDDKKLERCTTSGCIDMVSPNVSVDNLTFYVNGAGDKEDGIQPSVYILMKGTVKVKEESMSFAIQTMASQRNLE